MSVIRRKTKKKVSVLAFFFIVLQVMQAQASQRAYQPAGEPAPSGFESTEVSVSPEAFSRNEAPSVSKEVQELMDAVNEIRTKNGAEKLSFSDSLMKYSEVRLSEIMVQFSHIRPDGNEWYTVLPGNMQGYQKIGENLAAVSERPEIPREIAASWEQSASHNELMNDPAYTVAGIAMKQSGSYVFCQMFFGDPAF